MRTSDRSPSIVPPGNEQDVYLVLDGFGGRIGQAWRETNADAPRLETVVADLLTASIAIRFASLVSIRRRAGRGTSRKTSPVSCADAAPKRPAIFRHRWKNSLIATRANIALGRPPLMNDELKHLSPTQNAARFRSKGPLRRAVDTSDTWINEQLCC